MPQFISNYLGYMKVRFDDLSIFGNTLADQLDGMAMLGIVNMMFFCNKHQRVETRRVTRDLNNSQVTFSLLPLNVKTPPPHVITWIDMDLKKWRCCRKSDIIWVDNEVEMDE